MSLVLDLSELSSEPSGATQRRELPAQLSTATIVRPTWQVLIADTCAVV
jgi:hypothetical protein